MRHIIYFTFCILGNRLAVRFLMISLGGYIITRDSFPYIESRCAKSCNEWQTADWERERTSRQPWTASMCLSIGMCLSCNCLAGKRETATDKDYKEQANSRCLCWFMSTVICYPQPLGIVGKCLQTTIRNMLHAWNYPAGKCEQKNVSPIM